MSAEDIAIDVVDAILGLDDEYLDDIAATLQIGADPTRDDQILGQIFYEDGREADVVITVAIFNPKGRGE